MDFANNTLYTLLVIPLVIWDLTWKGISLWHSSKENSKYWFIAILLVNSAGLLPIIYYFYFRKNSINDKKRIIKIILLGLVSVLFITIAMKLQ